MDETKPQYSALELKAHEVLDHLNYIFEHDEIASARNPKTWPRLTPFEKNLMSCVAHLIEASLCYHDRKVAEDKLQKVWENLT